MRTMRKYTLALSLILALTACTQVTGAPGLERLNAPNTEPVIYRLNLKGNPESKATISLSIKPSTGQAFGVKNSTAGQGESLVSNILSFEVFLVDSAGIPTGNLSPVGGTFTIAANTLTSPSDIQNIVFNQVPVSGNQYYACAAAFNNGTPSISNNMTQPTNTSYANGDVICSNSGGNGGGSVTVTGPSYTLSNLTALTIPLALRDAIAATLDTNVTVSE